ncbi:MAG: CTP synthase [Candidatus Paceibacterota bacterium]|jgi:CTP synthase
MAKENKQKNRKYIFVVGGVISGVGKGIAASSIGKILQSRGLSVTAIKIDPYVNIDAGTMNPTEHGEVFVLDDGDECDQDMGNYERFLDITLSRLNYMTTGRVYESVIRKERNLEYGGKCVQVVPHIPLEVINRIEKAGERSKADFVVIEIGGTVGEYENILFLEAARMLKIQHPGDVLFVMVSYLPIPSKVGEMKTKPTQHAVRNLNSAGIQPDILIARSVVSLDKKRKEKLGLFCNIEPERVISAPDVDSIYDIPLNFEKDKMGEMILKILGMERKNGDSLSAWKKFFSAVPKLKDEINIAIVGKYFDTGDFVLSDSYLSVIEAVKYSAYTLKKKPILTWINSKDFEANPAKLKELKKYDGIIVPGGFGESGIDGILKAIRFARENKVPYLGLCYGMQLAVVEYARNVVGLRDANTAEINPNAEHVIIDIMPEQKEKLRKKDYGGSMRLGGYVARLKEGTIAQKAYGKKEVIERHRHRYEVNPEYIKQIEKSGLVFSGASPDGRLMEIAELPKKVHPFFLATQFHPEFLARPFHPHPLFTEFFRVAIAEKKKK